MFLQKKPNFVGMWMIRKKSPWSPDLKRFYPKGCPPLRVVNDYEMAVRIKNDLELLSLKRSPISMNYEYWDVVSDKELIRLDDFLQANYGFNILAKGYATEGGIKNDDVIEAYFPSNISDEEILKIQEFIGRFHYGIQEITEKGKFIVRFLRMSDFMDEVLSAQHEFKYFDSAEEAKESILSMRQFIRGFNSFGSVELIGYTLEEELTTQTRTILESQDYIKYIPYKEDYGGRFYSETKLEDIPNGKQLLYDLLSSLEPLPFEIIKT